MRDETDFTAFCYFHPDTDTGVLLAFRPKECVRDTLTLALPFAGDGEYTVTSEDSHEIIHTKQLTLYFPEPRTARLL